MRYIAFSNNNADFYTNLVAAEKIELCRDESKDAVEHNNADVAILDGNAYRVLGKERNYRHLREVYLPLDIGIGRLCKAFVCGASYFIRRRLIPYAVTTFHTKAGVQRRFLKIKVRSTKTRNYEFDYYPSDWTPLDFLKFLDNLGVRYVALRWHDKILHDKPMKDLDVLIADEDIRKVGENLDGLVGRKMVHMHSVSGGEREKVDQMAYFPPKISRHILENRVPLTADGGFRPSDQDYFLSLAYHAVVDKGAASGLPETAADPVDTENKFYKELTRLKDILGLDVGLNLEALVVYLEECGWLPPSDRLAKFVARNKWLEKRIKNDLLAKGESIKGDYTVFLFREIVREWGILPELLADLKKTGFEIVFEKELNAEDQKHISLEVRGGNWSPGPWKTSGGKPFYAVLVRDPKPKKMSRKQLTQHPFVQNARLLNKGKWRDKVNSRFPKEKQANFVHSSDNTREALEYISVIAPDAAHLIK
jgi:hypothetical protein